MSFAYSVQRILKIVGQEAECVGTYSGDIVGIAALSKAAKGDLSFLGNPKYVDDAASSAASVLLLPKDYSEPPQEGQLHIKLQNPSFALALLCRDIEMTLDPIPAPGVHPTAFIEEGAAVSPSASIGPFCHIRAGAQVGAATIGSHVCIGRNAKVGDETRIFAQVVIGDYCEIGPRNRLYAGCVIGSDGYGYEFWEGAHQRVPQIGNVITGSDVDIGANSTIDRARFGSTLIGTGTKIDNLAQIGHNVQIGRHCLIIAQAGISGSTVLEDGVVIAGQAGVAGHLTIGAEAMVAGGAAAIRSVAPKERIRGPHGDPFMTYTRIIALQKRLPELFKRFTKLEKRVDSLIEPTDNQ